MAEREGFEPPLPVKVNMISRLLLTVTTTINILAASGFPVGDPNILWVVVLMGMMPPTEDTNPVRRSGSRSPFGSVRGCETHKPSA